MRVYPEPESWNEFYPNEIFIMMDETEQPTDVLTYIKMANIGAIINLHRANSGNTTYKKIGDVVSMDDMDSALYPISRG